MEKRIVQIITILFLLFCFSYVAICAEPKLGVIEDGSVVLLYPDGTWEFKYEQTDERHLSTVMPEEQLFKLAMTEGDLDVWEQYFEYYEGANISRTITGIWNYCWRGRGKNVEFLLKGVALSNAHELYYMVPFGHTLGIRDPVVSNLYFFWELGEHFERQEQFEESLCWYEELRRLYVLNEGKLTYKTSGENSLEDIDGKIYMMKLKLSK